MSYKSLPWGGVNYYYLQEIKEEKIVIDFTNKLSIYTKKEILEMIADIKPDKKFLENRYFYFENKKFIGNKSKTFKIKKMKIINYSELSNPNVPKPIINIF
jgi:hypothetical protein